MATYSLNVPKHQYKQSVLRLLNTFLNLTTVELSVLSKMLEDNKLILTPGYRKILQGHLSMSEYSLNNHIKNIKDKQVLFKNEDELLEINNNIVKSLNEEEFLIKVNVSNR